MARRIPRSFDPSRIRLDPVERYVRDVLHVDITNWAKFRYAINLGTHSSVLKSVSEIDNVVRQAYLDLGKTHYEVIVSLGFIKQCLDTVLRYNSIHFFYFRKSLKEFYIHSGSVMDNLARLIFIVNSPQSAFQRKDKFRYVRHWLAWAELRKKYRKYRITGYSRLLTNSAVREILNIRNNFVHNWIFPIVIKRNQSAVVPYCPIAVRYTRNYLWPYDKRERIGTKYRKYIALIDMVRGDYLHIESLQSSIFGKLIGDIKKFERNNKITIE